MKRILLAVLILLAASTVAMAGTFNADFEDGVNVTVYGSHKGGKMSGLYGYGNPYFATMILSNQTDKAAAAPHIELRNAAGEVLPAIVAYGAGGPVPRTLEPGTTYILNLVYSMDSTQSKGLRYHMLKSRCAEVVLDVK